jgi:uncharacterized protein (DUF1684 family)
MSEPHEHEHHHVHSWEEFVQSHRDEEAHYYADHFDWRGEVPPEDFDGPKFFPISEDWRLEARLDTSGPGVGHDVQLATSTGKLRDMSIAGDLVFEVGGQEHRLRAFVSRNVKEDRDLFVPFQDATSGHETYGAGRYVDIPPEEDGIYELDFNMAYSPSCAYSPKYDCPYPPPGNRLSIRVEAGEKVPFESH